MHCAILPTRDKSPFNLLFYKPPTSARNILIIVELGFSQFFLLCILVRLWVELTCIRRTKIYQPMMASTPETYPSSTSHDDFYYSGITTRGKTSQWRSVDWLRLTLNAGSFIYEEIIPDLESQLEIKGIVKNTWIQSIASSQFSVDNFSNFKVDKRSEVCKCDR